MLALENGKPSSSSWKGSSMESRERSSSSSSFISSPSFSNDVWPKSRADDEDKEGGGAPSRPTRAEVEERLESRPRGLLGGNAAEFDRSKSLLG